MHHLHMFSVIYRAPQDERHPEILWRLMVSQSHLDGYCAVFSTPTPAVLFQWNFYNHESRFRSLFFLKKSMRWCREYSSWTQKKLVVGNGLRSGLGHANDVVMAMYLSLSVDQPMDYVIASGKGHTTRVLSEAFKSQGLNYMTMLR